jgi:hypothetical protein
MATNQLAAAGALEPEAGPAAAERHVDEEAQPALPAAGASGLPEHAVQAQGNAELTDWLFGFGCDRCRQRPDGCLACNRFKKDAYNDLYKK